MSVSCTRLRILLNTICRKPGFNSLRTPLNHGAEQASNETLKQTQQRNWSNPSKGGQTALKEHFAELHYETASTTQQPRGEHRGTIKDCKFVGATTWQGQGNQIIHSPQSSCWNARLSNHTFTTIFLLKCSCTDWLILSCNVRRTRGRRYSKGTFLFCHNVWPSCYGMSQYYSFVTMLRGAGLTRPN